MYGNTLHVGHKECKLFIEDKEKDRYVLNPVIMRKLNEYLYVKKLINTMKSQDGKKINVVLLKEIINSFSLKYRMLVTKLSCGQLAFPENKEIETMMGNLLDEFL